MIINTLHKGDDDDDDDGDGGDDDNKYKDLLIEIQHTARSLGPKYDKSNACVYRFVVMDGSHENGKATLARAVFRKEMPTRCEVIIKRCAIKSEELAASVAAGSCQQITSIITPATKLCSE